MLHLLRKHQYGILLVVAILVIIAFTFWGDFSTRNPGDMPVREGRSLKVLDRTFPPEEVDEISRTFRALQMLGVPRNYGDPVFQHLMTMTTLSRQVVNTDENEDDVPMDFILNTALVRSEAQRLGISASEAECDERIQTLPRFKDPASGRFDPAAWSAFKNAYGGEAGAKIREVYAAVGDAIMFDKLFALIGRELPPASIEIDWAYNTQHQRVTAHVVSILKKTFEDQPVTDEEIKKFYDENRESPELQSDERRSVHYVLMPEPGEAELKDLNDTQKEEKQKTFKKKAHEFANLLVAEERKPFDAIAKELGLEPVTTELFARPAPPEALKTELELIDLAFEFPEPGVAEVVKGTKGYYAVELASIEPSKALEFDAAKERIAKLLKEKKQTEKFNEAVTAAREKIQSELAAGRTIAEAAKAAGLEATELPPFTATKPLKDNPNARQILSASGALDAGQLSEPLTTTDGQILVYIAKKELPKDPKMEDQKKALATQFGFAARRATSNPVFVAWFNDLKKRAVSELRPG